MKAFEVVTALVTVLFLAGLTLTVVWLGLGVRRAIRREKS